MQQPSFTPPTAMRKRGFTLIELSIVLVIIGLIVGGVLVGRDLIGTAMLRAQVTQIEKYQVAMNTFRLKFNNQLPGDISEPTASALGFTPRGQYTGEGDGNGVIQGVGADSANDGDGTRPLSGEQQIFWVDLSKAGLIDGSFTQNNITKQVSSISSAEIADYFPAGKIGQGSYVYVWSGGTQGAYALSKNGLNYFALSRVLRDYEGSGSYVSVAPSLITQQAYSIDTKVDDGLPQSGRVTAIYPNPNIGIVYAMWAAGGNIDPVDGAGNGGDFASDPWGAPTTPSDHGNVQSVVAEDDSCYNHSQGWPEKYTLTTSNLNCALSFQFQ